MVERLTTVACPLCKKPVRLDECKVNVFGEPVHEACLAEQAKERKQSPAKVQTFIDAFFSACSGIVQSRLPKPAIKAK